VEVQIFFVSRQGRKKSARIKLLFNKTLSIIQTNCIIKAVNYKKITEMTRRTADIVVAVAAAIQKVQRQKRQRSSPHKDSGYVPADFQAKKDRTVIPGGVSVIGRWPSPHSHLSPRLLNGQPSYSLNIVTADFLSLLENEVRAGGPFAVLGQPQDEPGGAVRTFSKKKGCHRLSTVNGPLQTVLSNLL
jgi:hypothetical protein